MEYNKLIDSINNLEFVDNKEKADAAIKATLGKVVSTMDEEAAKKFTSFLPEPLTYERLRSHQANILKIGEEELIQEISAEFNFNRPDAERLVKTVFKTTKENLSGEQVKIWEGELSDELAGFVEKS